PESALYHKSRVLYGLSLAKQGMKQAKMTIVVEGNMDVIALHQVGLENTVAVSGTALTEEQLSLMKRYGNEVRLFFDMDGAGQKAARKSAELALEKEFLVSMVALPFGKDAADMGKEDPEALKTAIAASVPAPKYFLEASLKANDQSTAEGKRKIVEEYTEFLLFIKNPIERSFWIKELSREIAMEEKLLVGIVNGAFVDRARKDGRPVPVSNQPRAPFPMVNSYSNRAERLREEFIALCCADGDTRTVLLKEIQADETRAFLEKHPLFFFILQAGDGDAISLIEDPALKSEAARLSFRILESPEFANLEHDEQSEKMQEIGKQYLGDLEKEVLTREKLVSLERDINQARTAGDKNKEHELLQKFAEISSGRLHSS
ncbi:MAG: toprim domain-containing protein, partial [Patescibacteria group bacterium]